MTRSDLHELADRAEHVGREALPGRWGADEQAVVEEHADAARPIVALADRLERNGRA